MNKIFQDAKDVHVTAVIVYGDETDNKLYAEDDFENQVEEALVNDAFLKGVLVVQVGTEFFRPVKVSGNKVVIADLVSSTATLTEYSAKAAD